MLATVLGLVLAICGIGAFGMAVLWTAIEQRGARHRGDGLNHLLRKLKQHGQA